MRRMLTAVGLITVTLAFGAACTSGAGSTTSGRAPAHQGGGRGAAAVPAAGAGSARAVCAAIRSAITADMTPLGAALGSVVGSATGKDTKRRQAAAQGVNAALLKIGTDIAAASAPATDAPVRSAAAQAVQRVNALAADPSVVAGVDSMADVPAVTARLAQATSEIASACQDS